MSPSKGIIGWSPGIESSWGTLVLPALCPHSSALNMLFYPLETTPVSSLKNRERPFGFMVDIKCYSSNTKNSPLKGVHPVLVGDGLPDSRLQS